MSAASYPQVQRVLTITLILNLAVALGKLALGMVTGALAIAADGVHSLMDGTGNVAGLIASRYAAQPPDDDHPYGHQRIETLAALLIGALLLLTAWEVIQGVLERLTSDVAPDVSPLSLALLLATLVINIGVSRYQMAQGRRLQSEIVMADAKNTAADVFVTLAVISSTVIYALTGWRWVDGLAALIVVLLIARAAWQIVRQTAQVLTDTAPYPCVMLAALVADLPHVEQVVRARSRGSVTAASIDIDVQVAPETTVQQTDALTQQIRQRIEATLSGITEIEVHFIASAARPAA